MKSAAAMLADNPPPQWIVTLDESSMDFEAHTRVVVSDIATLDIEGDAHDGPATTLLSGSQTDDLLSLLATTTADSIGDVHRDVLDGVLCVVSVIHGSGWCAFSEFNSAGMGDKHLSLDGPRLAMQLRSFYRTLSPERFGP